MSKILAICSIMIMVFTPVVMSQEQTNELTASTLDDLYAKVIEGESYESRENKERLTRFVKARDRQQSLLLAAQTETKRLEIVGKKLNSKIDDLDREISVLDVQLADRLGNFGELFGVTRQVAADTRSQIESSLISAQYPGREIGLEKIAKSKKLPTIDQLRQVWITLLQEQVEQGKVVRFKASIGNDEGLLEEQEVIRLGPFVALSEDKFLSFSADAKGLIHLARQPDSKYLRSANALLSAEPGALVNAALDPSRGTILGLLVKAPSLFERFNQGGLPGYAVSILAVIGLVIGLTRLFVLWQLDRRVKWQMENESIDLNNPLGRVLNTFVENATHSLETLELKLDDAILKEVPKLDRGLNTIKVLAAVAPLMGLLGTVVGMILTFQAITLWGTGEPRIMAGGISQALVTTVQGLVAAIPLLLLHSMAQGRAKALQQVLEEQSAGLVAQRAEQLHG